jgi:hypothetical protein
MKGRPAKNLKGEAKEWAERMGYHWAENTDPSVPFDGFLYRDAVMVAVKLMKLRYAQSADCDIEQKFPGNVADLRSLPVPPSVLRELWLRTQNERPYRRFCVLPETTAEIMENTRDNYRNSHYQEEYWKEAPCRIEIHLRKEGDEKER